MKHCWRDRMLAAQCGHISERRRKRREREKKEKRGEKRKENNEYTEKDPTDVRAQATIKRRRTQSIAVESPLHQAFLLGIVAQVPHL